MLEPESYNNSSLLEHLPPSPKSFFGGSYLYLSKSINLETLQAGSLDSAIAFRVGVLVLGHMLGNMLEHVPKHVPERHVLDRHMTEHVLARHVLGLKKIVKFFFVMLKLFLLLFRTACAIR